MHKAQTRRALFLLCLQQLVETSKSRTAMIVTLLHPCFKSPCCPTARGYITCIQVQLYAWVSKSLGLNNFVQSVCVKIFLRENLLGENKANYSSLHKSLALISFLRVTFQTILLCGVNRYPCLSLSGLTAKDRILAPYLHQYRERDHGS